MGAGLGAVGKGSLARLQKKRPAKHGRSGCPELLSAAFVLGSERGGHGTAVSRAGTGEAGGKTLIRLT